MGALEETSRGTEKKVGYISISPQDASPETLEVKWAWLTG